MKNNFKPLYSDFLNTHEGNIHLAAHSHHFWPNAAKQGHLESYEVSQKMSDDKWNYIFSELLPDVKNIISKHINYERPAEISFASNVHELMVKIISCYFEQDKIKILTTSNEFHSLSRQLKRFKESDKFEIIEIDNEADNFHARFLDVLKNDTFDLVIISHVAFNSGLIYPMEHIKEAVALKKNASFIIDAYHGYCAIPTDISSISDDVFYMAGGYKYAQAGEGMCFTTLPKSCELRPQITGWFASFSTLESNSKTVEYDSDGMRFWGSTMDFTAFFRFRSVWNNFAQKQIELHDIQSYVQLLKESFIDQFPFKDELIATDSKQIGSFITWNFDSSELTANTHQVLKQQGILTDFRANRLRFGIAPYISNEEIKTVCSLIRNIKS